VTDREPRPTPVHADGSPPTPAELTALVEGRLPGLLGLTVTRVDEGVVEATMEVTPAHLAPNGYLHAATVVALADTACGLGCRLTLPADATGFTTVEQKTSYLGTAREGTIRTVARLAHGGRRVQVWDATVLHGEREIALFRCTQLVLRPLPD
jgi:1,4-dihydroxy-2-naphthoyl-CoA hydrolase